MNDTPTHAPPYLAMSYPRRYAPHFMKEPNETCCLCGSKMRKQRLASARKGQEVLCAKCEVEQQRKWRRTPAEPTGQLEKLMQQIADAAGWNAEKICDLAKQHRCSTGYGWYVDLEALARREMIQNSYAQRGLEIHKGAI